MANDDHGFYSDEDIQNMFLVKGSTGNIVLIYIANKKMAAAIEDPNDPEIPSLKERGARIVSSEELDDILDPTGENRRLPSPEERRIARRLEEQRKRPTEQK